MKTFYETPAMELVIFETEDVITTSGGGLGDLFVEEDNGNWGPLN